MKLPSVEEINPIHGEDLGKKTHVLNYSTQNECMAIDQDDVKFVSAFVSLTINEHLEHFFLSM